MILETSINPYLLSLIVTITLTSLPVYLLCFIFKRNKNKHQSRYLTLLRQLGYTAHNIFPTINKRPRKLHFPLQNTRIRFVAHSSLLQPFPGNELDSLPTALFSHFLGTVSATKDLHFLILSYFKWAMHSRRGVGIANSS